MQSHTKKSLLVDAHKKDSVIVDPHDEDSRIVVLWIHTLWIHTMRILLLWIHPITWLCECLNLHKTHTTTAWSSHLVTRGFGQARLALTCRFCI